MSEIVEAARKEAEQEEARKASEIEIYRNTSRLISNCLEIIADATFPGEQVLAVAEVVQWLRSMKNQVKQELSARGASEFAHNKTETASTDGKAAN